MLYIHVFCIFCIYLYSIFPVYTCILYFHPIWLVNHNNNASLAIRDFYSLTEKQLKDWGVKHHQLILGKPSGDLYVDDKGIKDGDFFANELRS